MKDNNPIDELFRKKFQNHDFEPEEGDWEKAWMLIENQPQKTKYPIGFLKYFFMTTFSLIFLTGLGWLYFDFKTQHIEDRKNEKMKIVDENIKNNSKLLNSQDSLRHNFAEIQTNIDEKLAKQNISTEIASENHANVSDFSTPNNQTKLNAKKQNLANSKQFQSLNTQTVKSGLEKESDKIAKKVSKLSNSESVTNNAASFQWLSVQAESDLFGAIITNPLIVVKSSIDANFTPLIVDSIQTKTLPLQADTTNIQAINEQPKYFRKNRKFSFGVSGGLLAESSGQTHQTHHTIDGNIESKNFYKNQGKTGIFIEPEMRFKGISLTSGVSLWSMPQKIEKQLITNTETYQLTQHTTVIDTGYYVLIDTQMVWIPIKQSISYSTVDTISLQYQKKEEHVEQVKYIEVPFLLGFSFKKQRLDISVKSGLSWSKPIHSKSSDSFHNQFVNSHYSFIGRFRLGYFITENISIYAEPSFRYIFNQPTTKSDFHSGLKVGCAFLF